jgi:hypothetical protein
MLVVAHGIWQAGTRKRNRDAPEMLSRP